MVLLVVLLHALKQFLKAVLAVPEALPYNVGYLPDAFVGVGVDGRMHIFVFHDVQVLIGYVLALILFDTHQKLAVDDLLGVLMRSHTSIYEFHEFAYVFELHNVRHNFRHHFLYSFKIVLLELYYGSLQQLHKIFFNDFGILNRLLPTI